MNRWDKWPKEMIQEHFNLHWGNELCLFDQVHVDISRLAYRLGHRKEWITHWDSDNDSITCIRKDHV